MEEVFFEYTSTKLYHTKLDGKTTEYRNSPIPVPMNSTTEQRSNVQHVAAFCSSVVRQAKGEWENIGRGYIELFSQDDMNSSNLYLLGELVKNLAEGDSVWKVKTNTEKACVTGARQMQFVMDMLNRLDELSYDYVNFYILVKVLQSHYKKGEAWYDRLDENDKPAVPKTMYQAQKRHDKSGYGKRFEGFPGILWYTGGYSPITSTADRDGTLQNANVALAQLRQITGGDKSTVMLLSGMKGLSGFATDFGKRIHFFLAVTLWLWKQGRGVEIRVSSIGDIAPLLSSLQYQEKKMRPIVENEGKEFPKIPFRFMPDKRKPAAFPESLSSYIIHSHTKGAVALWYNDASLPTSDEKGEKVDFDMQSQKLLPPDVHEFVAYSTLFGAQCFPLDNAVLDANKNRTKQLDLRRLFAYEYGTASRFCGVLSTLDGVSLMGYGVPSSNVVKTMNLSLAPSYQEFPLKYYGYAGAWYDKVVADIRSAYTNMFGVKMRYSPHTNLMYVSKKSVQMLMDAPSQEGDMYVDTTIRLRRKELRINASKPVSFWQESEEEHNNSSKVVVQSQPKKIKEDAPPGKVARVSQDAKRLEKEVEKQYDEYRPERELDSDDSSEGSGESTISQDEPEEQAEETEKVLPDRPDTANG